jgi:hypothetical protein
MVDEELLDLLRKKDDLQNNSGLDDDLYYILDEELTNIIINSYSLEEIKKGYEIIEKENR